MNPSLPHAGFQVVSPYQPAGEQPQAIEKLVEGFESGLARQTLLGVTGSGKTYTIANVIQAVQKPTLVLAPNKTLAAQLYGEFRSFFPHNAVEYFVSYYDYFQPEAYVVASDTFIEKDSSINEHIEQMRLSATKALLDRFVQALQARDQKALLQLLAQDATWTSDGGGKTKAALKVVRGAGRVARFLTGVFRNLVAELECRPALVNGEPGLVLLVKGKLFSILAVRSDGQRILDAYNIMNPDKLKTVQLPDSRAVTKPPPQSS